MRPREMAGTGLRRVRAEAFRRGMRVASCVAGVDAVAVLGAAGAETAPSRDGRRAERPRDDALGLQGYICENAESYLWRVRSLSSDSIDRFVFQPPRDKSDGGAARLRDLYVFSARADSTPS